MSEEDLELLITTDDPGEDTLGEDTFHNHPTDRSIDPHKAAKGPVNEGYR